MTVVSYKNVKRPIIPPGDLPMLALFARGEQGAWYDPSDMATMFQDAGGTIPVTSVEQRVGLILDKSGNGNHASQLTAPARPTLSARVNNLLNSENFAAWTIPTGVVATLSPEVIAPDGVSAATLLKATATSGGHLIRHGNTGVGVGSATCRSLYVKRGTARYIWISVYTNITPTTPLTACFDFDTGSFPIIGGGSVNSAQAVAVADGWYRISYHRSSEAGVYNQFGIGFTDPASPTTYEYTADGTQTAYIWGAQHEIGTTATRYQRVTSATNYDWQGWPLYLKTDGVDDAMASAATVPVRSADGAYAAVVRSRIPASGTGYQHTFGISGSGVRYFQVDSLRSTTSGQAGASVRDDVNYSPAGGYRASLGGASDPVNETHCHEGWLESGGALNMRRSDSTSRVSPAGVGVIDFSGFVAMGNPAVGENIYGGIYVSRSTTSTERAAVRKFLTDKTKVPA